MKKILIIFSQNVYHYLTKLNILFRFQEKESIKAIIFSVKKRFQLFL